MKLALRLTLIALLAIGFVAVALYVPTSLPADADFSVLYNSDLALLHRVPIYDIPQVEAFAVQFLHIPPDKVFAFFPYPPWVALGTFFLALLPVKVAVTLWFELNLLMLFLSINLLTQGWKGRLRLAAFLLGLVFYPVLGTLAVGQFDLPVLLGTALLLDSLKKQNVAWTVVGAVLLTFKPHIGALILLAALIWLVRTHSAFRRKAIVPLAFTAIFLVLIGFLADPAWPIRYPQMLLSYKDISGVQACTICTSLPVWISNGFSGGSLLNAAWIALVLLLAFSFFFYLNRSALNSPDFILNAAVLVTFLVSPYLLNYDFLLLLIPFALLINQSGLIQKVIVGLCYVLPTLALILFGRGGNITLIPVTLVLLILFCLHIRTHQLGGNPVAHDRPSRELTSTGHQ